MPAKYDLRGVDHIWEVLDDGTDDYVSNRQAVEKLNALTVEVDLLRRERDAAFACLHSAELHRLSRFELSTDPEQLAIDEVASDLATALQPIGDDWSEESKADALRGQAADAEIAAKVLEAYRRELRARIAEEEDEIR